MYNINRHKDTVRCLLAELKPVYWPYLIVAAAADVVPWLRRTLTWQRRPLLFLQKSLPHQRLTKSCQVSSKTHAMLTSWINFSWLVHTVLKTKLEVIFDETALPGANYLSQGAEDRQLPDLVTYGNCIFCAKIWIFELSIFNRMMSLNFMTISP